MNQVNKKLTALSHKLNIYIDKRSYLKSHDGTKRKQSSLYDLSCAVSKNSLINEK